ncbi:MAG: hypothetical protein WC295_02990 [Methanoregula sp.]|jgi:hypothetical protein
MPDTNDPETPFTCPRCGYPDKTFHEFYPKCQRPYFRDYLDTRFYPRDPNPQGIYKGKIGAHVFLVLTLLGLALSILVSFHIIWEEKTV